jgi:hypothetical protein
MTVQANDKEVEIELWREHGFNVFPIKGKQKGADHRYDAERTELNQVIKDSENWGVMGRIDEHNGILDFDDKELYRKFATRMIKQGYKVIESPHGWHIPFVNMKNTVTKIELFNTKFSPDKLIEIQGYKQYVIGVGSWVNEDKKDPNSELVTYKNVGSNKFWDVKGKDFGEFVDKICSQCDVYSKKHNDKSRNQNLREKFMDGKIPVEKESNDYFLQSARVCLTDKNTKEEALERIRVVYDEWKLSKFASDRTWYNVESKVNEVYENPDQWIIKTGKHTFGKKSEVDRTAIALKLLDLNDYYSNKESGEVFQNKNGFLELINPIIGHELFLENPKVERADISEVLNKIKNGARDMPETNKDMVVFKNGTFDSKSGKIVETEEIADMGFRQFEWLEKTKSNEPKEFMKFFKSYPKSELPRFKAGLKAIFSGYHDSRITVLHGISRVGKTTIMSILCKILGSHYAFSVDLDLFLTDRATMSKINGKRLVVFQDLPETWKDFAKIKNITGESQISIRGFNQDLEPEDNKIKIFATANKLPSIKESVKNAMYSDRLSLIHNIEKKKFKADNRLEDRIIKAEAEKIVSWIVNLTNEECEYEDTVETEWEALANPQEKWLDANYKISTGDDRVPVMVLCKAFEVYHEKSMKVSIDVMTETLKELGYTVHNNIVKNIIDKPKPVELNSLR